ncbi:MAG: Na+/H+ antiporter subunit E [Hyphomicrobiaceae bacterium]|nr:Na+/H+ antiporter subunit E [Hyphomicrobiaceae bacterium]
MTNVARFLPQPYVTAAITVLWMVLAPSPSLGNLLLGALIGVAIPWITNVFWPGRPRPARPAAALALTARVIADIVVANVHVARLVLGPMDRLAPAFVDVPLDIDDPFVATVLGAIVSLTPGTVSIDIDREKRVLNIHALDAGDADEMIATIKSRYEAPLKEIFGC